MTKARRKTFAKRLGVMLADKHARMLEQLAQRDGASQSATLRNLILQAHRRSKP